MKALLVNPNYPQTFWSFNKVLKMMNKKCIQPPLGLLTVAALLPNDWELRLADGAIRPVKEEDWDWADVVLITGMTAQYTGIIDAIRQSKQRGKLVVVGGPMVFHVPDDAFAAGADIIVRGEAEPIATELIDAIEQRLTNIVLEAPQKPDLKDSPPPRYDLLEMDSYVDMSIQFSRGCPFKCEFCDITLMFGRTVRTKSPEQILHELEVLYNLGWRRLVFFVDDNFIGNPAKTKDLLNELIPWMENKEYPFEFNTQASVNLAKDSVLLNSMAKAGFWKVFLGIESLNKETLTDARKFQNASVDLDNVCKTINAAGIQIIAGCILGFDAEGTGADQHLIQFAHRNNIPEMFVTMLQAGPGTELWHRLEDEGRLLFVGIDDNFGSQTAMVNFETKRPKDEIAREFINLYNVLYQQNFYLERVYNHIVNMGALPYKKGFAPPYFSEVRAVIISIFNHGVRYSGRLNFWKKFLSIVFKYPDRFRQFISACIVAEHYYEYRNTIKDLLEAQLKEEEMNGSLSPINP